MERPLAHHALRHPMHRVASAAARYGPGFGIPASSTACLACDAAFEAQKSRGRTLTGPRVGELGLANKITRFSRFSRNGALRAMLEAAGSLEMYLIGRAPIEGVHKCKQQTPSIRPRTSPNGRNNWVQTRPSKWPKLSTRRPVNLKSRCRKPLSSCTRQLPGFNKEPRRCATKVWAIS